MSPNPAIISDHTVTDALYQNYKEDVYLSRFNWVRVYILSELKEMLIIKNVSTYLCQQTPLDRPHIRMQISHTCKCYITFN